MNDLRRDINEVFAKQQGQLADVAGTGNRMLRAATAGRRVNRQLWPSAAGLALVLVAASAIGVSIVIRGMHAKNVVTNPPSPTPIATPTATPAPTPMSQLLQVPATTPVILFRDSASETQLDGITWDGSARGRVAVDPDLGNGFWQNPAGTLYHWIRGISDRTGALVAASATGFKGFGTWTDDGQHYCSMVSKIAQPPAGISPSTLQVTTVGQPPRNVVQIGSFGDQTSVGVAACSLEKDRAIVVQSASSGNTVQFWVVKLSTGRILWTRPSGDIRSSRDGQYITEISYNQSTGKSASTIYSPSGAVLGHVAGRVEAFSWDGSLAVQMADYNGPVSIIRWRDGKVLWNGPVDGGYLDALPEPGGQRIAVTVRDPKHPQTGGFAPGNVYVVGPDGHAVELLTNVFS
jgi:hypothetical protein